MKLPPSVRAASRALHRPVLVAAWLLLAVWAGGIVTAAAQLGSWREELTRTLTQLNADAYFRARAQDRSAVDPEWYRRKALALISATERLQRDRTWTFFLPDPWGALDDLEERVQARLAREFADIVVETVRRELHAKAAHLTGVGLAGGTGELRGGVECQSPVPRDVERKSGSAPEELPEFVAVADYVAAIERLDQAVQSFLSLHYSSGHPDQLRQLLAYTIGKDVPGALSGSARMFQSADGGQVQRDMMQSRLQGATRCSLRKAMGALHTRLLNTNDLFALEQGLVERSSGLFEPATRPAPFDRTLERYRAVHALLQDQHALLAHGRNDWMRQASLQLGPRYQDVLARIARTRLLGPEVLQQLHHQSGAAFAEFRRQFDQAFGGGDTGIVWLESEQRFGLSPERAALRDGLAGLLQASFMAEDVPLAAGKPPRESASLGRVVQEARGLVAERARVQAQVLPVFPPAVQPVIARVVNARVSELIYQRAYRTLKAALPTEPQAPFDPVAFQQQRQQVAALHALLKETGSTLLGDRLVAALDGELLRRLAVLQDEWRQQPWQDARLADLGWWHGETLLAAQALGAADSGGVQQAFSRSATRMDQVLQQAKALLALGSPALVDDPAAARWTARQGELDRYTARAADSSLLRLERYFLALGPDFRRDNCGHRLAAAAPTGVDASDEIAQRHRRLHQALAVRCQQLRELAAGGEQQVE